MAQIEISAEPRDDQGKSASRRLRREDRVPAILYGGGKDPQGISLDEPSTFRLLNNETTYSSIIKVNVGGTTERAVVKDVQRHPYKPKLIHIDFQRISENETIRMHVPLHFLNEDTAPAVKAGGVVSHQVTEVEVQCLPKDLVEFIEVDLAPVELGHALHLSDINLPAGIQIVELARGEDHDQSVVSIALPKGSASDDAAEGEDAPEES